MDVLRSGEESRRIGAPASALYDLVSDVTRTGLWAVECEACRWLDGVSAAAVGARFEGDNRFEEHTWSTVSVVDEVVYDRRFAYHTEADGQPITRWHVTFRPDGDATVVTEGFERVALPDRDESAFEDDLFGGRVHHNLANIAVSLERLASLAETSSRSEGAVR